MSHANGAGPRGRLWRSWIGDAPLRRILCALTVLLATAPMAAEVYRTVESDGTVSYSDRPEGADAKLVHVVTHEPPAPPPATQANSGAKTPSTAPSADSADGQSKQNAAPEPTAAEKAEQRQKNCKIARERVERYSTAHRLYRTTPDGEREYLNDAEIDEARARAAADVETWCS